MFKFIWEINNVVSFAGLNLNMYLSHILEDNYPEMMKRLFLINGKFYFQKYIYIFLVDLQETAKWWNCFLILILLQH